MTAIVGVLNRQGVAFAADSAVTHSKVHKITNHANKIFSLSKYRPIGIAIYNSAGFMGKSIAENGLSRFALFSRIG